MFLWDRLRFASCLLASWRGLDGRQLLGSMVLKRLMRQQVLRRRMFQSGMTLYGFLVEPYWEKDVNIKLEPVLFAIIGEMVSVFDT